MTVNYQRIKDATTMATEPFPGATDPLISLVRTINTDDDYNQLMLHVSTRPTIQISTITWHPMWSAYVIFQDYKSPCADGTTITLNHPCMAFEWQNDLELPKDWRVNIKAQWLPKGDMNNFRITRAAFDSSLGLQHDFDLHRFGTLSLDLRCYDVLQTHKNSVTIYGFREITSANPARRTFMLDLGWKFNEARSKYRGSGAGEKQKARMQ